MTFSHRSLMRIRHSRMPWNRERRRRSRGPITVTTLTTIIRGTPRNTPHPQATDSKRKVLLIKRKRRRKSYRRHHPTTAVIPIPTSSDLHSSKNINNKINSRRIRRNRDRIRGRIRKLASYRGKTRGRIRASTPGTWTTLIWDRVLDQKTAK